MNILLLLNSSINSQKGIEDGFSSLVDSNLIKTLEFFYYESYYKQYNLIQTQSEIERICDILKPNIIVLFHIAKIPFVLNYWNRLKLKHDFIFVYDEGDMYGGWAKPMTKSMKEIMKFADFVSIRGLGKWYNTVNKYNKNILYTPHSNSLYRQTKSLKFNITRSKEVVFIGNRVNSRVGNIRRLSGASQRENTLKKISVKLEGKLSIYGNGWNDYIGNKNKLEFEKQVEICSKSWFHLSYEHYPEIPYYFSDRLPISLACGQIYICHYHKGYEQMFKGCDFIYFYNTPSEALDIINYLMSLPIDELKIKSENAINYCKSFLSPLIVWRQMLVSIID